MKLVGLILRYVKYIDSRQTTMEDRCGSEKISDRCNFQRLDHSMDFSSAGWIISVEQFEHQIKYTFHHVKPFHIIAWGDLGGIWKCVRGCLNDSSDHVEVAT